ncbi:GerAB/ArcD/ProY family transporter [Pontibacillus yanchengensis]|uniref:GerAB/ArcD/ProY family transporter n=2 Tax=Pontibacillus yanchengensis TaxID=462910 RepID=A0ACC7VE69_9BACI|nr:GerAB/ArcD/ProY family transporter [Pontibacillus yanchengensis]MYL32506.1 GerAB/ArcD/ProY family transporter [Pontibacillus yanchengensis]MYL53087.1 GerAB/ArcD/ProY family transporter [Pontibacillus yanchengensis]
MNQGHVKIKANIQITAFYLFFIIHTMQIGAGIMGVPQIIYKESQNNAWISVLIAGVFLHLTIFVMISLLEQYKNADLFAIQKDVFGKWISRILGTFYILYILTVTSSIMLNYTEVVQVFIFPKMPSLQITFFLLFLATYAITGGFRVVVGSAYLFFFLTIWLVFSLYEPVRYIDWDHYLPVIQASPKELMMGAFKTTFSVLGLEVLLFVYPFISNKNKVPIVAHLAVLLTTILTFLVTFISIGYFSGPQLEGQIWPTLAMFKIIQFSILERFDFIAVAFWGFVILPNVILFIWLASYGAKRLYHVKQKHALYVIVLLLYAFTNIVEFRFSIDTLTDLSAKVGFYTVFVYPFLLLLIVLVKKKLTKSKGSGSN